MEFKSVIYRASFPEGLSKRSGKKEPSHFASVAERIKKYTRNITRKNLQSYLTNVLGHLLPSFMCFVSEILSFIPIRVFEINFYHDYKFNLIDFIYYKLKKNMNTKENK